MSAQIVTGYIEDPLKLLEYLEKDSKINIVKRTLPWDKDVEIIDFYLNASGKEEDQLYTSSKCRIV